VGPTTTEAARIVLAVDETVSEFLERATFLLELAGFAEAKGRRLLAAAIATVVVPSCQ
jgi:hypothetical protein